MPSKGDEVWQLGGWRVQDEGQLKTTCHNGQRLQRTTRPIPDPLAKIKQAFSEGKQIQIDLGARGVRKDWQDMSILNPSWDNGPEGYRVKPEPEYVPLDRTDVKMGQEVSCNNGIDTYMITGITDTTIFACRTLSFLRLFSGEWKINRNNGEGWVLCRKQKIS